MSSASIGRDDRGRILPGSTLNPKGKPKGSLSKAVALRNGLAADLPEILEAVVRQAKAGDLQAARLVLDRVMPALRAEAPTNVVRGASQGGLVHRAQAVFEAAAEGQIGADAALQLIGALGGIARIIEVEELATRLTRLEERIGAR